MKNKPLTNCGRRSRHSEAGVVIIMMAFLTVVLLALIGFALGIGFLATERSRLQSIGNIAALSAMDRYIQLPLGPNTEAQRRQKSVDRANFIVSKNKLLGTSNPLGDLGNSTAGDGGVVRFGSYLRTDPGSDPCSGSYPCFKESATGDQSNAVMLNLKNQATNPIVRPLKGFLKGQEEFQLDTTSYATLVNTCVGHLMDVSASVTADSHIRYVGDHICDQGGSLICDPSDECLGNAAPPGDSCTFMESSVVIRDPFIQASRDESGTTRTYDFPLTSMFAFDAKKIFQDPSASPPAQWPCTSDNLYTYAPDLIYWCNMFPSRAVFETDWNGGLPAPAGMVFRSDYELQKVFRGNRIGWKMTGTYLAPGPPTPEASEDMLVYKKARPEPMNGFLLGANMAVRIGEKLPSESNRGFFWAFTGNVNNRAEPQIIQGGTDKLNSGNSSDLKDLVTSNLAYLTQLTNTDILGGIGDTLASGTGVPDGNQQHPNALDAGFFPMDGPHVPAGLDPVLAAANHILVLYDAGRVLNAACEVSARRTIFLYTDGISTCKYMPAEFAAQGETPISPTCNLQTHVNQDGDTVDSTWPNYLHFEYTLLQVLIPYFQDLGITVNVILDGPAVNPNFINREDPTHPHSTAAGGSGCSHASYQAASEKEKNATCYLGFNGAEAAGYNGMQPGASTTTINACNSISNPFFGCASTDSAGTTLDNSPSHDQKAFHESIAGEDVTFGRATAVFGELAIKTGGTFCPLMNVAPVGDYYDHDEDYWKSDGSGTCTGSEASCCLKIFNGDITAKGRTPCRLKNTTRTKDALQTSAVEFVPKSFQSALCAQRVLEQSPYIMAEPLGVVLN